MGRTSTTTCPRCSRTSAYHRDVEAGWCAACNAFYPRQCADALVPQPEQFAGPLTYILALRTHAELYASRADTSVPVEDVFASIEAPRTGEPTAVVRW